MVVDVAGTEAERRTTRVDVGEIVVGIGDDQVAGVLVGVGVAVADEGGLPVVVQVGVGDGDVVRTVGDIKQTIVVVLVVVTVRGQIQVVEPDVVGGLDGDGVTVVGEDLADLDVADDDVGGLLDTETNTGQGRASSSDDGLVRGDIDLVGALNGTINDDNGSAVRAGSGLELLEGGDGSLLTSGTTGGTAVLGGVTDVASLGHSSGHGARGRVAGGGTAAGRSRHGGRARLGGVRLARLDDVESRGGRDSGGHQGGDESELHFESV